jgi:RNA polymerase sigma-70 factor (ECF subfamily)
LDAVKEIPETRESLLLQIQSHANRLAWEEFVEIYRPVVYGIAVSRGLQHADALDLVQTVFVSVAGSIARWEKRNDQTRFRNWLLRIAKNATINALTRRPLDHAVGGEGVSLELIENARGNIPSEPELDLEYKRQVYLRAAEKVRAKVTETNWMAFELTALEGVSIEQVARELGKSVGTIYAARSRIMKQLSDIVSRLEESYE